MVSGRMVLDERRDGEGNNRSQFKVQAVRIGILPFRVTQVQLEPAQGQQAPRQPSSSQAPQQGAYPKAAGPEGEWDNPAGSDPSYSE